MTIELPQDLIEKLYNFQHCREIQDSILEKVKFAKMMNSQDVSLNKIELLYLMKLNVIASRLMMIHLDEKERQ